jgi:hypothetical protein
MPSATLRMTEYPNRCNSPLDEGVHLMLIPTGGFSWVIGDREVAGRGQSECIFSVHVGTEGGVDELSNARTSQAQRSSRTWTAAVGLCGCLCRP